MFGALDISTSALEAQRVRLNTISANMSNQFTVFDADGNHAPYRRRIPVFAAGDPSTGNAMGVHVRQIMEDPAPFRKVHVGIGHPLADDQGYMSLPNINPMVEMANALEASRAYEANITVAETTKSMMQAAVSLLA
jgi:flagellar basal-body rod protein FlgC